MLTSLVVANLTAVIGFGVLGLSSLPVLHSIGTTVAPGALLALALAAIFARRGRSRPLKRRDDARSAAPLAARRRVARSRSSPPAPAGRTRCRSRLVAAPCATPVDTLIVLLPGARDKPHDFVDRRLRRRDLRSRGIAADVALVDATIPYYRDRDIVARLDEDVVEPARARGIRHVWFAGISLGGLGSLIYANEDRARGDPVDGLLVIAPYLGERTIVAEVAASGGLAQLGAAGHHPARRRRPSHLAVR